MRLPWYSRLEGLLEGVVGAGLEDRILVGALEAAGMAHEQIVVHGDDGLAVGPSGICGNAKRSDAAIVLGRAGPREMPLAS